MMWNDNFETGRLRVESSIASPIRGRQRLTSLVGDRQSPDPSVESAKNDHLRRRPHSREDTTGNNRRAKNQRCLLGLRRPILLARNAKNWLSSHKWDRGYLLTKGWNKEVIPVAGVFHGHFWKESEKTPSQILPSPTLPTTPIRLEFEC